MEGIGKIKEFILKKYSDKPDNYILSIGHWEEEDTFVKGIKLPKFHAYLKFTLKEFREGKFDI